MPFELVHLVVGMAVGKRESADFLAGLIYPDIRYPAGIDRNLTHLLEPIKHIQDSDFYLGVKMHLDTDKQWDDLFLTDPRLAISTIDQYEKGQLIGVYKLMHDIIAHKFIFGKHRIRDQLNSFLFPEGLPITQTQWEAWVKAICLYVEEGPTHKGLTHIVESMKFQTGEEFGPRLKLMDHLFGKYESVFKSLHQEFIERMQDYAGIA